MSKHVQHQIPDQIMIFLHYATDNVSHPVQPVSAAHPRCQYCAVGRSEAPGSGRHCWTCTAGLGSSLEPKENMFEGNLKSTRGKTVG